MRLSNFIKITQFALLKKDGEPLFVAKDVCSVLGIRNNRDALATLAA